MLCHFYLRRGIVYIPTFGKIGKGFYRGVEPVAVVPLSNTDALRRALNDTIARGNPSVPDLPGSQWPPPVTLKYAGVQTWSAFERGTSYWGIEEDDGIFRITFHQKAETQGFKEDKEKRITFPPGATVDEVIDRMIAILRDAAG
jgi:hypothetical protein